eukprot:1982696-Prorocentrum_lima.AAC.1
MTSSLVGSEMCIRDSLCAARYDITHRAFDDARRLLDQQDRLLARWDKYCLLYTSDAADDM